MVGLGNADNTTDLLKPVSTATQTALNLKAALASPSFSGIPLAPTAVAGTNTTQVATTAFVTNSNNLKANLASPNFTGTVTAPTFIGALTGNASTVTTNANLTGEVTSVGNAATLTNSAVIGKVLAGYVSGAGTVSATDNILQAIQKLNGNIAAGSGAVTNVSSANTDISIATGTTTPVLSLNSGSGANQIAKRDGSGNLSAATFTGALAGNATSATTAGTVTTNANLAGDVTSVGNTTTLANTIAGAKTFTTSIYIGDGVNTDPVKLWVNGKIKTRAIKVDPLNWPDYVFSKNYDLPKLSDIENFIVKNKHLPEVPSAMEVGKEGVDLGKMNEVLLRKIEELTLYLIDQNKRLEKQQSEIDLLKLKVK